MQAAQHKRSESRRHWTDPWTVSPSELRGGKGFAKPELDVALTAFTHNLSRTRTVRSNIKLWSESYLVTSESGFTFDPLVWFWVFSCWRLALVSSPGRARFLCPLSLLFTRLFHFCSLLCCHLLVLPVPASCVFAHLCVCVCLLIYFFRSLGDALVERTVTIGRVSLPGPSTRPTFVPGKYMQGVFLWPNRASGPPKLSSNTSLHISRMLNAAQHIAHKWNKGTCCDTDALLFLFQYFTWHRVSIYSFFAVYYAPTAHHFETNGISCRPDWFSRVLVHPHHCHWST